ncbi:MAG TPA: ferrous iron transport protein B [Bryobacteraceae bacterium]|nr:ferrous iron transport protein B [Bryobacteraceae bacterium]
MDDCHGSAAGTTLESKAHIVALIGPPNSGKTTLFNRLTGLRQKVANFPGVTVEQKTGRAKVSSNREVLLVDLPGVYSLRPCSEDERVTHDVLFGKMPGTPKPDAILLILDSTNLARHLTLAVPILSLDIPTLVILNMVDDLERRGGKVDSAALAAQLGAPVAMISAAKGEGVDQVARFIEGTAASGQKPRARRLELPVLQDVPKCRAWASQIGRGASYQSPVPSKWSQRLDALFLHPFWGPLVFALVVIGVFQTIFSGAAPLMDGVDALIASSGKAIGAMLPDGLWKSLLIDGIWSGVGSVVIFLPQILLLFLFLGILEDSGYLARAALIADRSMTRVGLQGKSFIPLLSAYACAVPAIMSTRTIENKRDRIATILIAPFMTCSARLPVYTLLIAAFIPERQLLGPFLGTRAAAMISLYALGFFAAFATAKLLKSSVLKSDRSPFVLEMPPYRWPTVRSLALRLYDRARVFLRRAGTVILTVAVVLWVLANLPLQDGKPPALENSIIGQVGHVIEPVIRPLGFNWKIGIGLITSLAAREVIVGTLGTIYGIEEGGETTGLQEALRRDLTFGGAVALLVFFAFAMQCMSTVAVVRRETGGWRWPIAQFAYMTSLAYACGLASNALVSQSELAKGIMLQTLALLR